MAMFDVVVFDCTSLSWVGRVTAPERLVFADILVLAESFKPQVLDLGAHMHRAIQIDALDESGSVSTLHAIVTVTYSVRSRN